MAPGYAHRPAQEIPAQNCLISRFKPSKCMPSPRRLQGSREPVPDREEAAWVLCKCVPAQVRRQCFYLMNFKLGGGRKHQQLRSVATGRQADMEIKYLQD